MTGYNWVDKALEQIYNDYDEVIISLSEYK